MNGTLSNYLLHILSGSIIWTILWFSCLLLGMNPPHWVATFSTIVWWYSHETADREYYLPGAARKNISAAAFWKWRIDDILDFLSGILFGVIVSLAIEIL